MTMIAPTHRYALRMVSLLAALCVAMPTLAMAVGTGKPLGMVTGPQTGTYYRVGNDLASILRGTGIQLQVKPSLGSIDNLRRMSTRTENAGLGIVQSDVLGFLKRSQSAESQSIASKLRMVAPLYAEEVHVIARRNIASIAELNGKRIVVGTEGSGNMITAMNVFSLLEIKPETMYKVAPPEGMVAVLTGQADAAIFVGGKPLKLLKNLDTLRASTDSATAQTASMVHMLPLDDARLSAEYEPASIQASDYGFITQTIPTIAVRAVLVSYDFTLKNTSFYHARCAELGRVGKTLRDKISGLQRTGHPKWKDVDLSRDVGLWRRDACAWPAMQAEIAALTKAPAATQPKAATTKHRTQNHQPKAPSSLTTPPSVPSQTQRLQQDLLRAMKAH